MDNIFIGSNNAVLGCFALRHISNGSLGNVKETLLQIKCPKHVFLLAPRNSILNQKLMHFIS